VWRPSWVRRTALFVAGAGAVLLLDLAYASTTYALTARQSARHLRAAIGALDRSDAAGAVEHLALSSSAAELAVLRAGRPSLRLAAFLGLHDDVVALELIAGALGDLATSAQQAVGPIFDHGAAEAGLFGALYRDGAVDLDAVALLNDGLRHLATDLERTDQRVAAAPEPRLAPIASALERVTRRLERARTDVARAVTVMDLLPPLLGSEGSRRYLLAFQSPSEARGGGGLIGVFGLLSADGGRLDLGHVGAIEELVGKELGKGGRPIPAPAWFRDLYGRFLGTEEIRHANLTPSFSASAEIWLRMYRRATGEALDGVIALDPLALGEITRGTGPLRAPGWDRTIDRFGARRVLLHDIYRHFDLKERKQNEYLRGLIDELWSRLESGEVRAGGLARGLGTAATEQHLKVYVPEPRVTALLAELQIDGDYRSAGPNVQLVFHNNFAANKVDFFLKRRVDTELVLEDDGDIRGTTTVELVNEAPEDTSVLVRPLRRDLDLGLNRMALSFLLPEGAEPRRLTLDRRDSNFFSGTEYDYPVAWQILDVEPGQTRTVRLSWTWPDAWQIDPDGPDLELTLWPQALVRPDFMSFTVVPPDGLAVAPGSQVGDTALDWEHLDGIARRAWRLRPPVTATIDLIEETRSGD
jgi:uncharacterized protein YndB with AHSA1/START domain